jgi:hypothetical protein
MTETDLQRTIREYLERRWGAYVRRTNTGAAYLGRRLVRFGSPGTPDLEAVLPPLGQYLGVETKAKDGRLRPAQAECHRRIRAAGGEVVVARDFDGFLTDFWLRIGHGLAACGGARE